MGKYLLINTDEGLFLQEIASLEAKLIEAVSSQENNDFRSFINQVRWAPDSAKFCFRFSGWNSFTNVTKDYIYELATAQKRPLNLPFPSGESLRWDKDSRSLYGIASTLNDQPVNAYQYDVSVTRVDADSLNSYPVVKIPSRSQNVAPEYLESHGVDLFNEEQYLSYEKNSPGQNMAFKETFYVNPFVLPQHKSFWQKCLEQDQLVGLYRNYVLKRFSDVREPQKAPKENYIGIDSFDYLYYVKTPWEKKRLLKIPREPIFSDPQSLQKAEQLIITNIRWIPGGRYVLLEQKKGVPLLIEPDSGHIAALSEIRGDTIGWPNF